MLVSGKTRDVCGTRGMHQTPRSVVLTGVARTAVLVGLGLMATCGGSQSSAPSAPATPTPVAGPTPPGVTLGTFSVSGVVAGDDGQPISGASVNAWVDLGRSGYSYWYAHGQLVTDAAGTYRMTGLPSGAQLTFQTGRDGYQQQCAAPLVFVRGDTTANLMLTSMARVTATPISPPGFRSVSGTVVQVTASGKEPLARVFVDFEPVMDFPAAITSSDTNGRFGLCGLPENATVSIGAGLGGRVAYVDVPPGQTAVEIVLPSS